MRGTVRALLLAAVCCLAVAAFASPADARANGDGERAVQRADLLQDGGLPAHGVHPLGHGGASRRWPSATTSHVDATENAAAFTDENLEQYDVVIFLCTTGDVLNAAQQAAFERYIRAGGGYAGIHSASDTEYDWPFYGELVGAYFRDHPGVAGVNAQFQTATIRRRGPRDARPPRTCRAAGCARRSGTTSAPIRATTVHVLMSVDESTYDPRGYSVPGGSAPMGDHPISWCRRYQGGRSFYTALGHKGVYWSEPLLLDARPRRHRDGGRRRRLRLRPAQRRGARPPRPPDHARLLARRRPRPAVSAPRAPPRAARPAGRDRGHHALRAGHRAGDPAAGAPAGSRRRPGAARLRPRRRPRPPPLAPRAAPGAADDAGGHPELHGLRRRDRGGAALREPGRRVRRRRARRRGSRGGSDAEVRQVEGRQPLRVGQEVHLDDPAARRR